MNKCSRNEQKITGQSNKATSTACRTTNNHASLITNSSAEEYRKDIGKKGGLIPKKPKGIVIIFFLNGTGRIVYHTWGYFSPAMNPRNIIICCLIFRNYSNICSFIKIQCNQWGFVYITTQITLNMILHSRHTLHTPPLFAIHAYYRSEIIGKNNHCQLHKSQYLILN